jgi:hypothetical protein
MATWTARTICAVFGTLTVIVGHAYRWNPTVLPGNQWWAALVTLAGVVVLATAVWIEPRWLRAWSGALLVGAFSSRMVALLGAWVLSDLSTVDRARAIGGACVWLMTVVSIHLVWRWGVIPSGEAAAWRRSTPPLSTPHSGPGPPPPSSP